MNLGQVRAAVRSNLNDAGVTFYDDDSINQSIQDAYNETASKCYCIIKSAQIAQRANEPYYDFLSLGITDYLGAIGIYNQSTRFWLRDDVSVRDFDRIRRDWEIWVGSPQFWTPHSFRFVAIAPNLATVVPSNLFTLWYWATAPSILGNDNNNFLIANDQQNMLEFYATADKLEDAEEMTKAAPYWQNFYNKIDPYRQRCRNIAKADLLLRV